MEDPQIPGTIEQLVAEEHESCGRERRRGTRPQTTGGASSS